MEERESYLNKYKKNNICYLILSHEINQKTFEPSFSGKERCKELANQIIKTQDKNYFILFMGLGRKDLMGKCKLSISQYMFNFFCKNHFTPNDFYIEKRSFDTVGDAIFSYQLIKSIGFKKSIFIITSDWHMERVKYVFKKIYKKENKLFFIQTSEIDSLSNSKKIELKNKELYSIKLFDDFIKKYDQKTSNFYSYLQRNHKLYENLPKFKNK
tara:strand:- start:1172 stop:1810 length:639 start_codon:yes stop_codon:yes gene_type:complete